MKRTNKRAAVKSKAPAKKKWHGMNWITRHKRLAIYLRDGLGCIYCGLGVDDEVKLTLDHITPRKRKGTNAASNLVTSCHGCNSKRQAMPFDQFLAKHCGAGFSSPDTIRKIARRSLKPHISKAKLILAERTFLEAMKG